MPDRSKELVLAAASGSTGGLGKVGTLPVAGIMYVRLDCDDKFLARADWRVKCDKAHTIQLYRSQTNVSGATLTFADATRIDDTNTFLLQGLTYTAESTAADAAFASRKFYCGGADATADAVEVVKLVNADTAIVPDGSVVVGDTLVIVTTDDAGGTNTYTYTAAAAPVYASRIFDQSGNQAAELASLVLAINHKRRVTLATCLAGTTITFTVANGVRKTYTAHASTTTAASREFSIAGTDTQDGAELVTCLNDSTYGLGTGYTAVNAAGVVSITRNSASVPDVIITSSNGTTAACANTAGGVPGVIAAASGATGELYLTPTWVKSITATGGTHITATDIDCPGTYATSAIGVVTLSCATPGTPTGGSRATTINFNQGTSDANEAAFASTTLASLTRHGVPISVAADTTTNGLFYEQYVDGWAFPYLAITNNDGAAAATVVVGATRY